MQPSAVRCSPAVPLFRVHGDGSIPVGPRIPLPPVPPDVDHCLLRNVLCPQPGPEFDHPRSIFRVKTCGDEAVVLNLLCFRHGRIIPPPLVVPRPCRARRRGTRWGSASCAAQIPRKTRTGSAYPAEHVPVAEGQAAKLPSAMPYKERGRPPRSNYTTTLRASPQTMIFTALAEILATERIAGSTSE